MKRNTKKIFYIFLRYFVLILIALPGFDIFYFLFSPITIYPLYFLLDKIYGVIVQGNTLLVGNIPIEIIGACIAGSAYYLLLILNLSIPNVKINKRILMIAFSFGIFYLINLLRIFILSIMYINSSPVFDFSHKLFWYLGSTIFVIGIWFLEIKVFKIKEIPFYSDLKYLYNSQKNPKNY
jgi:exosortase/archaeosortase family protein